MKESPETLGSGGEGRSSHRVNLSQSVILNGVKDLVV